MGCIAGNVGNMYYNSTTSAIDVCTCTGGSCPATGTYAWTAAGSGGGGSTLDAILAAAANQTGIDSGAYTIVWDWNSLVGGSALTLGSTSTAAASNTQTLLNIALSGANATSGQTTYAEKASNTHTGSGTNVGLYTTASGGTNNYAAIFNAGNVGIGTTTPTQDLSFGGAAARTVWMERSTTAAGDNLTIQAGGAKVSGTIDGDSGGNLILSSGISTGAATSKIQFTLYPGAGACTVPCNSDNAALTAAILSATGATGSNAVTTLQGNNGSGSNQNGGVLSLASGVSTGTGTSSINFQVYGAGLTGSTANNPNTAMTIASTGYVGIGTAGPQYLFQVLGAPAGNGEENDIASFVRTSADEGVAIGFYETLAGGTPSYSFVRSSGNIPFGLGTSSSNTSIYITTAGDVGIGTTTPAAPLDVELTVPGTVSSTGVTVTGSGTTFTKTFVVGDMIYSSGQSEVIATITNDTSLTTSAAFNPVLASSSAYSITGSIFNAGAVGIGTATPAYPLEVASSAMPDASIYYTGTSTAEPALYFRSGYTGLENPKSVLALIGSVPDDGGGGRLDFEIAGATGTLFSAMTIQNISPGGTVGTWINLPTSGASAIGSGGEGVNPWIGYVATAGNWFTGSIPGDIVYRNTGGKLLYGTSTGAPAMAVFNNNVGIATTTPANYLSVANSTAQYNTGKASQSGILITGVGTTFTSAMVGGTIVFSNGASAPITLFNSATALTSSVSQSVSSPPGLAFNIYYPGLEVTSQGRVGMGTSLPAAPLDEEVSIPGTVSSSSTTVTGTNTTFTKTFAVGDLLYSNGQASTVSAIASDTSLTTTLAFSPVLASGSAYTRIGSIFNAGNVGIGTTTPRTTLTVAGPISLNFPTTAPCTSNAYTVAATDSSLIFNDAAGCTVTLPAANSYPGRILLVSNNAAGAIVSTSGANVEVYPPGSATAGTAILPATAGAWAILQSNVTDWVTLASGSGSGGGSSTLNGITAATADGTLQDSAAHPIIWNWNSLAGGNGLTLGSTSTAAASNTQTLLNIALSGANGTSGQTTYAEQISNTHTGTGTNIGLYATASGGTNNYAAIFNAGNVGIGTTSPSALLTVAGTLTATGTTTLSGLTTAGVVLNSAAGVLSTSAGPLAVANGGTGLASGTQYGLPYFSTTTAMTSTGAGTTGQFLEATTGSSPVWAVPTVALNNITAAGASSTIDNTNYAQTWNWSTLTSGAALTVAATNTGANNNAALAVNNASTGAGVGVNGTLSGTSNSGSAIYGANTGTGNSGSAVYGANSGSSNTGYGGYFTDSGSTGAALGVRNTSTGFDIAFLDSGDSNATTITAPATMAASQSLILPATAGTSGEVLTTSGGSPATLSWSSSSSGATVIIGGPAASTSGGAALTNGDYYQLVGTVAGSGSEFDDFCPCPADRRASQELLRSHGDDGAGGHRQHAHAA